jgi:hypothetical protein
MYSHGHGISSVVVIQLTLAVRQVLYTHPTFEFLTSMSCVTTGTVCVQTLANLGSGDKCDVHLYRSDSNKNRRRRRATWLPRSGCRRSDKEVHCRRCFGSEIKQKSG